MIYDTERLLELAEKISNKIINELRISNMSGEADSILKKYGFLNEIDNSYQYIDVRNSKILVIGDPRINVNDMKLCAKKNNISEKHLVFFTDYEKMTNFDVSSLFCSPVYSDIMVGPIPHKIKGMGDHTDLVSMIKCDEKNYPKLIELRVNGEFKISKTSFEKGLQNTKYYLETNY